MSRKNFFLVVLVLAIATFCKLPSWAGEQKGKSISKSQSFRLKAKDPAFRWETFLFKDVVIDSQENVLRLARSVLLTDELGATDFHQTEPLGQEVQAKKIFVLESLDNLSMELFFFGSAKEIELNGKPLPPAKKLESTGWSRLEIPTGIFKVGKNEFVFKGGGQLLVEPSKKPGHSLKSTDGGKTWQPDGMTGKGSQEGEYLVRLRLGRYVPMGWAISQVLDLWDTDGQEIAIPGKLSTLVGSKNIAKNQPAGTGLTYLVRLGSQPNPESKSWTEWMSLEKGSGHFEDYFYKNKKIAEYRWAQVKFELTSTKGLISPRIPSASFYYEGVHSPIKEKAEYQVSFKPDIHFLRSSTPFVYQKPSPRLKLLRERYKLDQVIAPGKTELEQLMLLRYWVRNQWHTAWGNHPAQWMPQWDALMILANKDQPDCLTMCTHYAAVYTQCCLALGWNARHCILDHHCVAEVYVNELGKWVMMDAGNSAQRADVGLHFEKDGVPMSARELHLAYHGKKTEGIQVRFTPHKLAEKIAPLCRPAPATKEKYPPRPDVIPLADLKQYPVCQLENYRRYAFPARNNYLDSLLPGELYQGWSEYFYDGYYWVGDSPDNPQISPEYSQHISPHRPQDADWQLNWTQVYLSRTEKPNQLKVDLATFTPNFLTFERTVTLADGKTKTTQAPAAAFIWDLHPGKNRLTVWSVNQWDKKGMPMEVEVTAQGQ